VRAPDGTITEFTAPSSGNFTAPDAINSAGVIVGDFTNASATGFGFVRQPSGSLSTFSAPPNLGTGIYPVSINDAGVIAGYLYDATRNVFHGFVITP
jgi:hypothetical protein